MYANPVAGPIMEPERHTHAFIQRRKRIQKMARFIIDEHKQGKKDTTWQMSEFHQGLSMWRFWSRRPGKKNGMRNRADFARNILGHIWSEKLMNNATSIVLYPIVSKWLDPIPFWVPRFEIIHCTLHADLTNTGINIIAAKSLGFPQLFNTLHNLRRQNPRPEQLLLQ